MMCLTFGLFTQVSGSGPLGPLVLLYLFCTFLQSFIYKRIIKKCIQILLMFDIVGQSKCE